MIMGKSPLLNPKYMTCSGKEVEAAQSIRSEGTETGYPHSANRAPADYVQATKRSMYFGKGEIWKDLPPSPSNQPSPMMAQADIIAS